MQRHQRLLLYAFTLHPEAEHYRGDLVRGVQYVGASAQQGIMLCGEWLQTPLPPLVNPTLSGEDERRLSGRIATLAQHLSKLQGGESIGGFPGFEPPDDDPDYKKKIKERNYKPE